MSTLINAPDLTAPTLERREPSSLRQRPFLGRRRGLAVALCLTLIGSVQLVNLGGWPVFGDDEGTYVAQAWATFGGHLAHYTYWYDHPPGGWLQLAFFLYPLHLLGLQPSVSLSRYVMVGYTLLSGLLIYRLGRTLRLSHWAALAALLLWGLSPLVINEGREVLLDNIALPWVLGSLLLATSTRRLLWEHCASGLCIAVAVLTKETTLVIFPAVLYAVWTHSYRPTRRFSILGAAVLTVLVGLTYPLFAVMKGELLTGSGHVSLQQGIIFQLLSRPGSGSVLTAGTAAQSVLMSWLSLDPVLPVMGALAGVLALFVRALRPAAIAVVVMVAMALRPGGYLPSMYVIVLLPFAALSAVGVVEVAMRAVQPLDTVRSHAGTAVNIALCALLLLPFVPNWASRDLHEMSVPANDPYNRAINYMASHLSRHTRILVDDAYWNPLVQRGWSSDGWSGPIWYFKLDLDPIAFTQHLPNTWHSVNYIVVDQAVLTNLGPHTALPLVNQAYQHSTLIQQWGAGQTQVQLRKVTG